MVLWMLDIRHAHDIILRIASFVEIPGNGMGQSQFSMGCDGTEKSVPSTSLETF